jgi:peroxiredoxin
MKKLISIPIVSIVMASTIVFALFSFAHATKAYQIGNTISDFALKNSEDGQLVSLVKMPHSGRGIIVIFTCNHCPFAKKYEQRIMELDKKYTALGFPVMAISPSDPAQEPEDSYNSLGQRAKVKHYTFPYVFDETQAIAKVFGATKTPEAFLVVREDNRLKLKYKGAIDDNADQPQKVKNEYVADAIDAFLANKPIAVTETKPIGSAIKWKQS